MQSWNVKHDTTFSWDRDDDFIAVAVGSDKRSVFSGLLRDTRDLQACGQSWVFS